MPLRLDEKETRALLVLLESNLDDVVSVVKKTGYDKSVFFIGGDARGLDFRGSSLKGVSFRDADLRGCKFFRDQFEVVMQSKPRDVSNVQLFGRASSKDEVDYKRIIGQAKNLAEARKIRNQMQRDGIQLDDGLLASLVSKAKNVVEARKALEEFDSSRAIAGIETYNVLIGKSNKSESSMEFLNEIQERSLTPSSETFHRIIANVKYSDGVALLIRMDNEGISVTTGILATLAAKAPPTAARNMLKEAISRSIIVDSSLVHAIIKKCSSLAVAREVLEQAKLSGFNPDRQTFNALLSFDGSFEDAIQILEEMASLNIEKDVVTYQRLIRKAGNLDDALAVAEDVEQSSLATNKELEAEINQKVQTFGGWPPS